MPLRADPDFVLKLPPDTIAAGGIVAAEVGVLAAQLLVLDETVGGGQDAGAGEHSADAVATFHFAVLEEITVDKIPV